jgi:chromosome segregation ATPase
MSLSPIALEALRAAQSAFSEAEADVYEDALARGLEAVDREGRLVGAYAAAELKRLEARVAELEKANAGLDDLRIRALDKGDALRDRIAELEREAGERRTAASESLLATQIERNEARARVAELEASPDALTRTFAPTAALREDPHDSPLHHGYRLGRDLPQPDGAP